MERIRRRGEEEHAGGTTNRAFTQSRPWDWVFAEAVRDAQFWHVELEEPSLLLINRARVPKDLVGGEAPVAISVAKGPGTENGGEHKQKKATPERVHNVNGNAFISNRRGIKLCEAFQDNACVSAPGSNNCPKGQGRVRHCARCLDFHHGSSSCPRTDCPASSMPRWASGGGKGKHGKKGKGKGSWQY